MKTKLLAILLFFGVSMTSYGQDCTGFWKKINWSKTDSPNTKSMTPESPTDGRISLRLAGNGNFVTILIGFIPEGTVNFDDGFDGPFINDGAAIEFYSFLGTTRLSIQALPELVSTDEQVALGYELTTDGSYTISIDAEFLSPNFDIILEDSYQNTFTDLRQGNYTFSGITGEVHDRFFLNLNYNNTLSLSQTPTTSKEIHTLFVDDQLKIYTNRNDISMVTLFNMAGSQISTVDFASEIQLDNIAKGIYIVQFTTNAGVKISKKVVK
jgi:hypothetical protein